MSPLTPMSLATVSNVLDAIRSPVLEPWGVPFPLMDLVGAVRLAIVLRQIKKLKGTGMRNPDTKVSPWVSALILFGGEAIMCSLLSLTPGFLLSPNVALLFMGAQFIVNEVIPEPPPFKFTIELPVSVFDAFGRALLLCDFAPGLVARHPDPAVASSPLALLITSEVLTNGGFFFVNLLNMLDPRGWRVDRTPPEVLPWGWTTVDLWTAPVITALWATLTHCKNDPVWIHLHATYLSPAKAPEASEKALEPAAWSHSDARALCIVILSALFVARTWWNMGPLPKFKFKSRPTAPASTPVPSSAESTAVELIDSPNSAPKRRNKHSRGKSLTKVE